MKKETIVLSAYKTIQESLEFAKGYKENYWMYIDGVISCAENMIDILEEGQKRMQQ